MTSKWTSSQNLGGWSMDCTLGILCYQQQQQSKWTEPLSIFADKGRAVKKAPTNALFASPLLL